MMMKSIPQLWFRLFLTERPSISLSLFRIAVAVTVGFHVLPSFCHLGDNYFATAFKTYNVNFFTVGVIELIQQSPQWLIITAVIWFFLFWAFFLVGFMSQLSCIAMTLGCYYFYALNSFHVGTLSWDILLVTLFLMCITGYHGDYFSMDCLLKGDENAYKKERPYFLQRLLQLQVGFTFFYTALYKVTAQGNWLTDNPIYYLMNYPMEGVVKSFILRDFLMHHPQLCYVIGLSIVLVEFSMIFLLFWHKTRVSAIYTGIFFHILLILTLDVPAIFLFLFPPQLLLFINPEKAIIWVKAKRAYHQSAKRPQLIYDGACGFCRASVQQLKIMDLFDRVDYLDYQSFPDLAALHPALNKEKAASQIHLIEPSGPLTGGFFAFRRLSLLMPMLYPAVPLLFFPGMGIVGPFCYKMIAKNRYLFHFNKTCKSNACYR